MSFFILFNLLICIYFFLIAFFSKKYPILEIKTFGTINNFGKTHHRICDFQNWNSLKLQRKGIVLGSSTAYRNINTEILDSNTDYQWFNLGSTSQTPEISFELLKYANQKKNISVVLFDLYIPLFSNTGEECALDLIKNSTLPFNTKLNIIRASRKSIRNFNQLIYREIKNIFSIDNNFDDYSNDHYRNKGFVTNYNPAKKIDIKNYQYFNLNYPLFNEIRNYCNQNNIKIIFNVAPVVNVKYDYNVSNKLKIIFNQDFVTSNTKENSFYDSHHMTFIGSYLYTHNLSNKINKVLNK